MNYLINVLRLKEFNIYCWKLFYIFLLMVVTHNGFGQSTSGIGIGGGVNLPIHHELQPGIELFLKSDIKLSNRLALVPMAGFMQLKEREIPNSHHVGGELIFVSLSAKYYIKDHFFTQLGPIIAVGGQTLQNISAGAAGGSLVAGYDININQKNIFEVSFHSDLLNTIPVLGIRGTYKFGW
jgi:hypothetical protein